MRKAVNIKWDTDGDAGILASLPGEMEIPDAMDEEDIGDYLSDMTGFCHDGYALVID